MFRRSLRVPVGQRIPDVCTYVYRLYYVYTPSLIHTSKGSRRHRAACQRAWRAATATPLFPGTGSRAAGVVHISSAVPALRSSRAWIVGNRPNLEIYTNLVRMHVGRNLRQYLKIAVKHRRGSRSQVQGGLFLRSAGRF